MEIIKLFPSWEPGFFIQRKNRFVMTLAKDSSPMDVYIANPGRMIEYLVKDHPFYITPISGGKYKYKAISTQYGNSYVLLDTAKINTVVEEMIRSGLIPELGPVKFIKREKQVGRSRFDFYLEREGSKPVLLEVKSCSLCHNGVAMFPDAPTERGKRHMEELQVLAGDEIETFTLYLVTHNEARLFIPNCHTDPAYGNSFLQAQKVRKLAYRVSMPDPVHIDLSTATNIPVGMDALRSNCGNRGSYLLILFNPLAFSKQVGALGVVDFKKGYYVYAGSAIKGLEKRVKRHSKKRKAIHWHLDYILPHPMELNRSLLIRRVDRLEGPLASRLQSIAHGYIPGFGSSDTDRPSHLFYFKEDPIHLRDFLDILLDFRMGMK